MRATRDAGTFRTGLTANPAIKTTQTSPAYRLGTYEHCTIDIMAGTWTDGTLTPVVQYTNDSNGSANSGGWTTVPNADLILWQATSASDTTPVRIGNSQPTVTSSAATALNQRVAYVGGVEGTSDWIRVVTTVTGSPSTGCEYDVVFHFSGALTEPPAV